MPKPIYLSKSDFRIARTCQTKLYYRKLRYPSTEDESDYLQFLADGGYMVEEIAKLLHPEGREIEMAATPEEAFAETLTLLQQDTVTLFGATLIYDNLLARVDILVKRGNHLDLIEVKSKSYDSNDPEIQYTFTGKRGGVVAAWRETLEDVAFQTNLLRKLFPTYRVVPHLCLPDKAKTTSLDTLFSYFEIDPNYIGRFTRPEVKFTGDVAKLRDQHFLTTVSVMAEVEQLLPSVAEDSLRFAASLQPSVSKLVTPLNASCRDCEYRTSDTEDRNGFRECWGNLAQVTPHILDLYQVTRPGSVRQRVETLIAEGKASLFDIQPADLKTAKGEVGVLDQRRLIQLQHTRANTEWRDAKLAEELQSHAYPLHFIDFETSRLAVPYHTGMHPYEIVAFQWSCHTIRQPGGEIEHAEWINVEDAFPNFTFVQALMDWLKDTGTIYIWSPHELSVLREIQRQLQHHRQAEPTLTLWLANVLQDNEQSRFVDLCEAAKKFFFHPMMKGWISIKYVLPAVWSEVQTLHHHPTFAKYYKTDGDTIVNPYQTLPPLPFGEGQDEVVQEGTAAMRAYQEMLYGLSKTDAQKRENWKRLLLQYCELDTAAMVAIWSHWINSR